LTYNDDQKYKCEEGTYICEIIVNYLKNSTDPKESDPRTISVNPIAGGEIEESITLGPVLNDVDTHGKLWHIIYLLYIWKNHVYC
jgi:hypothetical protein